jgi:hypothetical protein
MELERAADLLIEYADRFHPEDVSREYIRAMQDAFRGRADYLRSKEQCL